MLNLDKEQWRPLPALPSPGPAPGLAPAAAPAAAAAAAAGRKRPAAKAQQEKEAKRRREAQGPSAAPVVPAGGSPVAERGDGAIGSAAEGGSPSREKVMRLLGAGSVEAAKGAVARMDLAELQVGLCMGLDEWAGMFRRRGMTGVWQLSF